MPQLYWSVSIPFLVLVIAIGWLTVVESTSSFRMLKAFAYMFVSAIVTQIVAQTYFIAFFHGKLKVSRLWSEHLNCFISGSFKNGWSTMAVILYYLATASTGQCGLSSSFTRSSIATPFRSLSRTSITSRRRCLKTRASWRMKQNQIPMCQRFVSRIKLATHVKKSKVIARRCTESQFSHWRRPNGRQLPTVTWRHSHWLSRCGAKGMLR